MTNEVSNQNYCTREMAMKILNVGHSTFDEIARQVHDKIVVKTSNNKGNKILYNVNEIKGIQTSRQQQQLGKLDNASKILANQKDISILGNAFMKKINDISADDDASYDKLYQSFMIMNQKMIEKVEERIQKREQEKQELIIKVDELENDKQELLQAKKEADELYNTRYRIKEIRQKINKAIRKRCWEQNKSYNEYYIEMYGKYDRIHCFSYRQDYTNYLDTIQARGHLKEFYEMILHS